MGIGAQYRRASAERSCPAVHRAVGTAAAFDPLIAVPGALGFIWAGLDVDGRLPFHLGL